MVELVGYLGSTLVIISLLMTRILRLRVIGLMGSATFLIYGLLIGSIPIMITNTVIIVINAVFLWRANQIDEWFHLLEVRPDSLYLADFLNFHEGDILVYQPDWDGHVADPDLVVFVLRDTRPAMLMIGSIDDDLIDLRLDYAIPQFNDYRMGKFLYESNVDFFAEKGVTTIEAHARTRPHVRYLLKMGFIQTGPEQFERSLG
ncbi:MAG: hypothetical protein ACR2NG_02245 [Acidimicrobiia bacterium]